MSKQKKNPARAAAHKLNPMITSDDLSSVEQTIHGCNQALTFLREAVLNKRDSWIKGEREGFVYLVETVQGALEYEQQALEAERGGDSDE